MKNRKATHRASDLSKLAKDAVASAKARRTTVLDEAQLESTTGGGGIGGLGGMTAGAILEPDFNTTL